MFREWLDQHKLEDVLVPRQEYHPFPTADERKLWDELPCDLKEEMLGYGEEYLEYEWPSLPAVRFMDYLRDGNRSRYEALHFSRREALAKLIIAECVEGKNRFIDDIINGIWHLCEESFWGVPAHNYTKSQTNILPDISEPIIDLFAAETAGLLAWAYYLLGSKLNEVSPLILERIEQETKHRILDPFLEREDFHWMGYDSKVNNWNPWVNSNCITAFLIIEKDEQRRVKAISKAMYTLDFFMDVYHSDGGCDEGTSYWDRAGASLFDCLEQLYDASQGKIDFYGQSIVQEIGRFIYRSYIAHNYFINFADGGAIVKINGDLVYRYGKRIRDLKLMAMGSSAKNLYANKKKGNFSLLRELPALFQYNEITNATKTPYYLKDTWLDGIQLMAAREKKGSYQGLYLAVKGGHNNESHNHNDIGQYIVYANGMPVIIDVGVETYTKKTFSGQRYNIWTMQSANHNLPTVNGVQQSPGEEFCSKNINYQMNDTSVNFSLDISSAYPKEAGILSWSRHFCFNREAEASIQIKDTFYLDKETKNISLAMMTHRRPQLKEGAIILEDSDHYRVRVEYDATLLQAISESIEIEDSKLKNVWGDNIYRIIFKVNKPLIQENLTMRITQER